MKQACIAKANVILNFCCHYIYWCYNIAKN